MKEIVWKVYEKIFSLEIVVSILEIVIESLVVWDIKVTSVIFVSFLKQTLTHRKAKCYITGGARF